MQFTQSLAYTRLLAKGVKIIDSRFRPLAKLDDDRMFDAMMEIAMETIDESDFSIAYFVRNENEIDEMEYELHMTLQLISPHISSMRFARSPASKKRSSSKKSMYMSPGCGTFR